MKNNIRVVFITITLLAGLTSCTTNRDADIIPVNQDTTSQTDSADLVADTTNQTETTDLAADTISRADAADLVTDLIPKAAAFYGGVFNGSDYFQVDYAVTIPDFKDYALVVDDNIKSVNDLKLWVESVVTPELAGVKFYGYLEGLDQPLSSFEPLDYRPLYYEYDGQLYVDTNNGGKGFPFVWLYDTIKIASISDTAIIAEINRTMFDEFDETSVVALEKRDGQWLIANDFVDGTE